MNFYLSYVRYACRPCALICSINMFGTKLTIIRDKLTTNAHTLLMRKSKCTRINVHIHTYILGCNNPFPSANCMEMSIVYNRLDTYTVQTTYFRLHTTVYLLQIIFYHNTR